MSAYKAIYLSPMIPSFHIQETASFFTEVLSFSIVMNIGNYAICQKDHVTVHLLTAGTDIGQMEFYMEIDDVDVLWDAIKDKINDLKHKEPFNQEYGMREIHIAIPQTNTLLFIGQKKNSTT